MTTEDQVVALFAMANPVPSLDLLDAVEPVDVGRIPHLHERSGAMTELKSETKSEIGGRRPRLVPVLAIAVIAVVALAVFLTRDDGVATPESLANAYMEARENLDAEAARALFAPDATVSDEGFDLSEMPALFAWYRASNWDFTHEDCTERSTGEQGTMVECLYEFENDWTRALGHAPVSGQAQIRVSDGEITHLNAFLSVDQFGDVWEGFIEWIAENHPDDFAQMYVSDGTSPLIDDNSIGLWEQYTDEFVASLEG